MMRGYEKNTLVLAICALTLAGCDSRVAEVNTRMQQIHSKPALPVPPPPVFLPVPSFNYAAQQLRSPFLPGSLAQELTSIAAHRVMPDTTRPPQFLETFELEDLKMRGTIQSPGGPLNALIESPKGGIMRIQVGNYMGKNYGRVVSIKPTEIGLIEIVPDGREGFIERPRTLVLTQVGT